MDDRQYIVLQEPGRVPETKQPMPGRFGLERMLIALQLCRPPGTMLTVCTVGEHYFYADSGRETLAIFRSMFPRLSKRVEREERAEHSKFEAARAVRNLPSQEGAP